MVSEGQMKGAFLPCYIPILLTESAQSQLDFPTGAVGGFSDGYFALVTAKTGGWGGGDYL